MVAKTILEQLGGGKFIAMTGCREFIDLGNGLRMNLAKTRLPPIGLKSFWIEKQTLIQ